MEMIPLHEPNFIGNEKKYVMDCLESTFVSSVGKYVTKLEEDICKFTGSEYAVACVNGTAALQISLLLAGVQAGDEVIVPTLTFIAPINTIRYTGAEPIFFDCDAYYNLDVEKVEQFLKENTFEKDGFCYNKTSNKRIPAMIPVHVFGNGARMEELMMLADRYHIKIIEDATESLGTVYKEGKFSGRHAGTIGHLGCLSFNGNKIITTGGGGMILTGNKELAQKAKYLTTQAKDDAIHYIHNEVGYNYRLTNIQAALGVAQLEQLPGFLEIKKKNYKLYLEALKDFDGLQLAPAPAYADNNHWLYALQIDTDKYGKNKDELLEILIKKNIQVRPLWYLNHLQKPYQDCQSYRIEKAPELFASTINIPSSVSLTEEQIKEVSEVLKNG